MRIIKPTALAGSLAVAACLLAPPVAAQTVGTGATETGSTGATTSTTDSNRSSTGGMGSVSGTTTPRNGQQNATTSGGTASGTSSSDINDSSTSGSAASDQTNGASRTDQTNRQLPRTASPFPLVAALGILSLAAAITLRRVSGRHAV